MNEILIVITATAVLHVIVAVALIPVIRFAGIMMWSDPHHYFKASR